jgi:dsRNA-specific ribonuclease
LKKFDKQQILKLSNQFKTNIEIYPPNQTRFYFYSENKGEDIKKLFPLTKREKSFLRPIHWKRLKKFKTSPSGNTKFSEELTQNLHNNKMDKLPNKNESDVAHMENTSYSFEKLILDEEEIYITPSGSKLALSSSVEILYDYCNQLDGGISIEHKYEELSNSTIQKWSCTMTFPMIETPFFAISNSKEQSKRLVEFLAVKKLHQIGALDDNFRPTFKKTKESSKDEENDITSLEFERMTPKVLRGELGIECYVYFLKGPFAIDLMFLYSQKIPSIPLIDLFVDEKMFQFEMKFKEEIILSNTQLKEAKKYYKMTFSHVFGLNTKEISNIPYLILPSLDENINWKEISQDFDSNPIIDFILKPKYSSKLYFPLKIQNGNTNLLQATELRNPFSMLVSKAPSSEAPIFLVPSSCEKLISVSTYLSLRFAPKITSILEGYLIAEDLMHEIGIPVKKKRNFVEAITSKSSFLNGDNERFEFLGDCVLKKLTIEFVYHKYPEYNEGMLSVEKDKLINNKNLFRLANEKRLASFILTETFNNENWNVSGWSKTIKRKLTMKKVADNLESILGVYFLQSEEDARKFLHWIGLIDFSSLDIPKRIKLDVEDVNIPKCEYKFKNLQLKRQSMTHISTRETNAKCYQRLEILGDAVIDLMVTLFIFNKFHELSPGRMTDLRKNAVQHETLSFLSCKEYELQNSIIYDETIPDLKYLIENGSKNPKNSPKIFSDVFESLCGAIYLDSGNVEIVWNSLTKWKNYVIQNISPNKVKINPITELMELCQKKYKQEKTFGFSQWMSIQNLRTVEFRIGNTLISKVSSFTLNFYQLKTKLASECLKKISKLQK